MNHIIWGLIFGLSFGAIDVAVMIPLKFDSRQQKNEAMIAAFIDRFMLGFLIPAIDIGMNPIITGVLLGLGLSLGPAIISKAYAPIIGVGVVGGAIIGLLTTVLV